MSDNKQLTAAREEDGKLVTLLKKKEVLAGLNAVSGQYFTIERTQKILINAVDRTPGLLQCRPRTVLGAMMASVALGLEPNTVRGEAYLIPFKRRQKQGGNWVDVYDCQFIIGYKGLIKLAHRNPNLLKLVAHAVYQNDEFEYCEGSESFLRHKPALSDRGGMVAAYAYAKYINEHGHEAEATVVLPLEEIHKIRNRSETYKALKRNAESDIGWNNKKKTEKDIERDNQKLAETPWVMWEGEMAAKSAIRRLTKILPLGDLEVAAALDGAAESGHIDLEAFSDADTTGAIIDGETAIPETSEDEPPVEEEQTPSLAAPEDDKPAAKPKAKTKLKKDEEPPQAETGTEEEGDSLFGEE